MPNLAFPRLLGLFVASTALLIGETSAADTAGHAVAQKSVARAKHARKTREAPITSIQTARLRYTVLSSLPQRTRSEFHADLPSAAIELADNAETRCANANLSTNIETVMPCLGLYRSRETPSPVKFSFDLALKSIGAPKDVLVGACPAGSNNATCNNVISESKAEQERLADTLNRQRRHPVATLGVALSF